MSAEQEQLEEDADEASQRFLQHNPAGQASRAQRSNVWAFRSSWAGMMWHNITVVTLFIVWPSR